jgi:hypothetical protein
VSSLDGAREAVPALAQRKVIGSHTYLRGAIATLNVEHMHASRSLRYCTCYRANRYSGSCCAVSRFVDLALPLTRRQRQQRLRRPSALCFSSGGFARVTLCKGLLMDILLACTIMVAAGASLLIAVTFRTWSRAYQSRFYEMSGQILNYEERIVALEDKLSEIQAMISNPRRKGEAQESQGES